jgi:hypothetical protein
MSRVIGIFTDFLVVSKITRIVHHRTCSEANLLLYLKEVQEKIDDLVIYCTRSVLHKVAGETYNETYVDILEPTIEIVLGGVSQDKTGGEYNNAY